MENIWWFRNSLYQIPDSLSSPVHQAGGKLWIVIPDFDNRWLRTTTTTDNSNRQQTTASATTVNQNLKLFSYLNSLSTIAFFILFFFHFYFTLIYIFLSPLWIFNWKSKLVCEMLFNSEQLWQLSDVDLIVPNRLWC